MSGDTTLSMFNVGGYDIITVGNNVTVQGGTAVVWVRVTTTDASAVATIDGVTIAQGNGKNAGRSVSVTTGNNTIVMTVTNGSSSQEYTVHVNVLSPINTSLVTFTIAGIATSTGETIELPYGTSLAQVIAIPDNSGASVDISGADGSGNVVVPATVVVAVSDSGYTQFYSVSVEVLTQDNDTSLSVFTIDGIPVYNAYQLAISYTTSVVVVATPAYGTVEVVGNTNLVSGDNLVTVTVTSANGIRTQVYAVNVKVPLACFLGSARVLTPSGYQRIDRLAIGDLVVSAAGKNVAIQRISRTPVVAGPSVNPLVIAKGQFGATARLLISSGHRVLVDGALVEARMLGLRQEKMEGEFTYYNLELAGGVNMIVAGVEVESLAPKKRVQMTVAEFKDCLARQKLAITPSLLRTCRFLPNGRIEATVRK